MAATHFKALPRRMQLYVTCISLLGLATIAQSAGEIATGPHDWSWTILAVLTLVSGSATVRLPALPATISVSETFVFTSVLLFGPAAGTLTVALDAFVISLWSYRKNHPLYKIVFNVCALPLTIWLAAHLFFLIAGIEPLSRLAVSVPIRDLLLPLLVFTLAYFGLNSWIITFAISLEKGLAPFKIWRENFLWLSLNYFGGASVAALLVSYTKNLDFTYLAVIIPLLVVLYFTFSMSMGRVEDANRHLSELNTLYMSTIETLAMAIDAKDQITHGHIRRVQTYTVALAKQMGITDEKMIQAVEAAALLHDMGKLAVPEYILNKPGPLTPTELEKMKLHASVGADILSAIDFPYPVVPIVRHHHENWDGSGYPDGLAGPDIPLGARILSVVDCFDALTSDRPYRPKWSDRDAIRVLSERRGKMYDPLVVDTFLRVHSTIVPPQLEPSTATLAVITGAALHPIANPAQAKRLEDITASSGEVVTLFALAQALAVPLDARALGDVTFEHLRRLIPHTCGVVFAYRVDSDDLSAVAVSGDLAPMILGLRIALGRRLSGWVAANRQTIRNSDPILDFGEIVKSSEPRLRSCIATPLVASDDLVGVLSIYSATDQFFTEEHQRILEAAATQLATALRRATAVRSDIDLVIGKVQSSRDEATKTRVPAEVPASTCVAILKLASEGDLPSLDDFARLIRDHLRSNDMVFKKSQELILLLHMTKQEAEQAVGRIVSQMKAVNPTLSVDFTLAAPQEGADLNQILSTENVSLDVRGRRSIKPDRSVH
jgi:putative nucleotidyltransferase with HDIG domain